MSPEFRYDVFLSHNQADKLRVRRLAERLRAAGLRVWLDEWVIQPGDDIYLTIQRGLETSRTLVLCLSPAALGSDWVSLERSTVLFRDPANANRRFIPLLMAECRLPDTLRRYKYVDFRQETEAAFEELLAGCTPGAGSEPSGKATQPQAPRPLIRRKRPWLLAGAVAAVAVVVGIIFLWSGLEKRQAMGILVEAGLAWNETKAEIALTNEDSGRHRNQPLPATAAGIPSPPPAQPGNASRQGH